RRSAARPKATPPSAARTRDPAETRDATSGRSVPPPATTTTGSCMRTSLRWYYPGQVLRVGGARSSALSARLPRAPLRSRHRSARVLRRAAGGRAHRPDLQPVRARSPRAAPAGAARVLPALTLARAGAPRRRGARVSWGTSLGPPLHLRATADGFGSRRADRDHRRGAPPS